MNPTRNRRPFALVAIAITAGGVLAACGGGTSATTATNGAGSTAAAPTDTGSAAGAGVVLPVDTNPISNTATADGLRIDSVLVENNVDPATGATADDHLEIALSNTTNVELSGFEIFYTFTDPATGVTENYYLKLPADFTIPAGGTRTAHFDDSGLPDHFPVNKFSLYYTDTNALDVTVTVSALDVKPQTTSITKDAGGAETAD